ncbi:hypothetical protein [Streptomyces sp. NRRL S-920]|uniref:hypothetical protein n=1 Tax=Streptomyces sp. NRRL S-920 TaxID=1463921 RepID=UPI000AF55A87|nr:hypothetical protein [Streptomyces sp. NRRL S-920]
MRLGKALATGIAEEQPRQEEPSRPYDTSVPQSGPKTSESAAEPLPVEATAAR